MNKVKTIIAAILVILVVIVILQNMESVETRFLLARVEMPRAVLLIITLLVGFGVGVVASDRVFHRKKKP